METLNSYVAGRRHEPAGGFATLVDPSTEEPVARASSEGIDFGEAAAFARERGGRALRALSFGERAALVEAMYKALYEVRDDLIAASVETTGTTRKDAKFDVDGASAVLHYYASLGAGLGSARVLPDGEGEKLGRSARFWGRHVRIPLRGVAVLINAFNFPLWGFAEKAAAAVLSGMPVLAKPATSTALVTARGFRALMEANILPEGAISLVCGSAGDLLARLGPEDVVAFTGSSATALSIRSTRNLLAAGTRVNVEADSLNAAVLGPDVDPGSETWSLFLRDVVREITQKSGQKCTAVRRVFVPRERADEVQEALAERLAEVVTGNPKDGSVTMGPLASAAQLEDAVAGVRALAAGARIVHGTGERADGVGAEPGKGYYFPPVLLSAEDADDAGEVHEREVFGPVATVMPFGGDAEEAAGLVARGGGSLVTSVYTDNDAYAAAFLEAGGGYSGRLYLGSAKMAEHAYGSGITLPQSLHGGPGRAGGGAELGGFRALELYTQRVALQGGRRMVEGMAGGGPA